MWLSRSPSIGRLLFYDFSDDVAYQSEHEFEVLDGIDTEYLPLLSSHPFRNPIRHEILRTQRVRLLRVYEIFRLVSEPNSCGKCSGVGIHDLYRLGSGEETLLIMKDDADIAHMPVFEEAGNTA